MWGEYLKYFPFSSLREESRGRAVWEKIARTNYPKYLHSWKKAAIKSYGSVAAARNHKPGWTSLEVWQELCDYWMSDAFLRASSLRKANLACKKGIPHTSGNITYEERAIEQEDYQNRLREKYGLPPDALVNQVQDHGLEIWQETVGGVNRGRLIGRPGERWSKRGVLRDYQAYVDTQESAKKWKKLEKDNKRKAKREVELYNFITCQNTQIKELSQFVQTLAEKCGMEAPSSTLLRPPPPPPCSGDGSSHGQNDPSSSDIDESEESDKSNEFHTTDELDGSDDTSDECS